MAFMMLGASVASATSLTSTGRSTSATAKVLDCARGWEDTGKTKAGYESSGWVFNDYGTIAEGAQQIQFDSLTAKESTRIIIDSKRQCETQTAWTWGEAKYRLRNCYHDEGGSYCTAATDWKNLTKSTNNCGTHSIVAGSYGYGCRWDQENWYRWKV